MTQLPHAKRGIYIYNKITDFFNWKVNLIIKGNICNKITDFLNEFKYDNDVYWGSYEWKCLLKLLHEKGMYFKSNKGICGI